MSGLSRRIHGDLTSRIHSGELKPGLRLATEHELAAQYGCARMTVSQALSALAREGLVERRRRAGTFVARPPVQTAVLEIPDIAAVVAARGDTYRFVELSRTIRPSSGEPAEAALGEGGDVLALDGVHLASARPFALEHRIVRLDAAPEAAEADFSTEGPGGWLLGHTPWSEARHRISAVCVDAASARRLAMARGGACLQVERWTWQGGRGVTFARQLYPADAYSLSADFKPPVVAKP